MEGSTSLRQIKASGRTCVLPRAQRLGHSPLCCRGLKRAFDSREKKVPRPLFFNSIRRIAQRSQFRQEYTTMPSLVGKIMRRKNRTVVVKISRMGQPTTLACQSQRWIFCQASGSYKALRVAPDPCKPSES